MLILNTTYQKEQEAENSFIKKYWNTIPVQRESIDCDILNTVRRIQTFACFPAHELVLGLSLFFAWLSNVLQIFSLFSVGMIPTRVRAHFVAAGIVAAVGVGAFGAYKVSEPLTKLFLVFYLFIACEYLIPTKLQAGMTLKRWVNSQPRHQHEVTHFHVSRGIY